MVATLQVAFQCLGLAGSHQVDPYTDRLEIAVGTEESAVGTADSAVDMGCKHFGSHIRTIIQD